LFFLNKKISAGTRFGEYGGEAVGVAPTGDHGVNEQERVIPMEKPLLGHHLRPF
jgi:hypothetical protein